MIDLYVQIQYVNRLGVYLDNFKQKNSRLWTFAHSCEEKKRGQAKSRGYLYQPKENTGFNFFCHHCGESKSLFNFMKEVAPALYDEYRLENYRDNPIATITAEPEPPKVLVDASLDGLIPLKKFSPTSAVTQFIERRKIPKSKYDLLFVAKNFYAWAKAFKPDIHTPEKDEPRLVLPYFDLHGRVLGFTARTFSPSVEPRYYHLRIDRTNDFVYGTERVDPNKLIYVTEGQIDSLFLDNAVAIGGAHYSTPFMNSIKTNCAIIPDNDWKRNSQVGKQVLRAIKAGFKVCFLPDTVKGKDLNDFAKAGMTLAEIKALVDGNLFQGLTAQLEYALRKKY